MQKPESRAYSKYLSYVNVCSFPASPCNCGKYITAASHNIWNKASGLFIHMCSGMMRHCANQGTSAPTNAPEQVYQLPSTLPSAS
jgi:hypothetical protein